MKTAVEILQSEEPKGKKARKPEWYKNIYIYLGEDNLVYYNGSTLYEEADLFKPVWEEYKEPLWEPKGYNWFVAHTGCVTNSTSLEETRNFGVEYKTKSKAEWARDKMKPYNRLLAWLAEQGEDEVPDKEKKWYILYDHEESQYFYVERDEDVLGVLYMTYNTVIKLRDMLNKGEIEL
jgi:hypothetical protein